MTNPFITYTDPLRRTALVLRKTANELHGQIIDAVTELSDTVRMGGTIYACGNGGSASQADHLVAELLGRFERERPAIKAVSLVHNATLTAVGNDYGYDKVFARQLRDVITENDCLVALSTSGTSANVQAAMEVATDANAALILISGEVDIAELSVTILHEEGASFPGVHLMIPSDSTATVQEVTLGLIHLLCRAIDDEAAVWCEDEEGSDDD